MAMLVYRSVLSHVFRCFFFKAHHEHGLAVGTRTCAHSGPKLRSSLPEGAETLVGLPFSGDSGMYPYQRTPMGNPYIRPI